MKLAEALPAYRNGGYNMKRKGGDTVHYSMTFDLLDLEADDWELIRKPKPPVTIDLVEYANGYEFEFHQDNYTVNMDSSGWFTSHNQKDFKDISAVYMAEAKVHELTNKLNSGEWVLK